MGYIRLDIAPFSADMPAPNSFCLNTVTLRQLSRPFILPRTIIDTRRFTSSKMGAPVILCGKTEQIGKGVVATLKPEFDGAYPLSGFQRTGARCRGHGLV